MKVQNIIWPSFTAEWRGLPAKGVPSIMAEGPQRIYTGIAVIDSQVFKGAALRFAGLKRFVGDSSIWVLWVRRAKANQAARVVIWLGLPTNGQQL